MFSPDRLECVWTDKASTEPSASWLCARKQSTRTSWPIECRSHYNKFVRKNTKKGVNHRKFFHYWTKNCDIKRSIKQQCTCMYLVNLRTVARNVCSGSQGVSQRVGIPLSHSSGLRSPATCPVSLPVCTRFRLQCPRISY